MKNNDVFCCCVAVKSTREKEMSVFSRDCNIVILVLKFWKIPFHGLIQEFSKFPTKQSLIFCKISQNFKHLRSKFFFEILQHIFVENITKINLRSCYCNYIHLIVDKTHRFIELFIRLLLLKLRITIFSLIFLYEDQFSQK